MRNGLKARNRHVRRGRTWRAGLGRCGRARLSLFRHDRDSRGLVLRICDRLCRRRFRHARRRARGYWTQARDRGNFDWGGGSGGNGGLRCGARGRGLLLGWCSRGSSLRRRGRLEHAPYEVSDVFRNDAELILGFENAAQTLVKERDQLFRCEPYLFGELENAYLTTSRCCCHVSPRGPHTRGTTALSHQEFALEG